MAPWYACCSIRKTGNFSVPVQEKRRRAAYFDPGGVSF
jgi:hypothetical protein